MEFLIVCLMIAANLAYLLHYGERDGFTIKGQLPPKNTPEGKRSRNIARAVVALTAAGIVLLIVRQQNGQGVRQVLLPILVGATVYLASYLSKQSSR